MGACARVCGVCMYARKLDLHQKRQQRGCVGRCECWHMLVDFSRISMFVSACVLCAGVYVYVCLYVCIYMCV